MAVNTNYSTPVVVNGYTCKNCTDVDYAKKHIDPAHPRSGPYGVDAKNDPTAKSASVTFGGSLGGLNAESPAVSQSLSDPSARSADLNAEQNTAAESQLDLLV